MPIIQIRDVPEDTYDTIRRRARAAGQSIQAYMLARLDAFAAELTPAEVVAQIRATLATRPPLELSTEEILEARDADRRW